MHTTRYPLTLIRGWLQRHLAAGRKAFAALVAGALLAASSSAAAPSKFVAALQAGKPQTVVTYGTSLTAGGAWVGQLRGALDKQFPKLATLSNGGKGGMWSKWGVENLEARVLQKNPDAVFIEFAINDAFLQYNTSAAQARTNLEAMIERILKARPDCEIILMTMNPPVGVHLERRPKVTEYYQMYRDVAKERKLRLIDHYPNWEKILRTDEPLFTRYVPDGIHPNAEGCAKVITPGILRALGLQAE